MLLLNAFLYRNWLDLVLFYFPSCDIMKPKSHLYYVISNAFLQPLIWVNFSFLVMVAKYTHREIYSFKNVLLSGIKYIHDIVQSSPLSKFSIAPNGNPGPIKHLLPISHCPQPLVTTNLLSISGFT